VAAGSCKRAVGVTLGVASCAALALAPGAGAKPKGFEYGVAAGDVSHNSAILWAKAKRSGEALVQVTDRGGFGGCRIGDAPGKLVVEAKKKNDRTVQKRIKGLDPGTAYRYRWCMEDGARSATGTFETAPDPKRKRTIRFGISGDYDALPAPGQSTPFWNNFEVLQTMREQRNDFNILIGDTIYSDTEVPGYGAADVATTVREKWEKYKLNLGKPVTGTAAARAVTPAAAQAKLRSAAAFYGHWDDHEFINDFSPLESEFPIGGSVVTADGAQLYNRGVRAFRDYTPVIYTKRDGLYRSFRWGKNLELFFLDEISFRSASADYQGACDNPPGSGNPDLAPTAPEDKRQLFSAVAPQLANPPPPGCLAAVRDPSRTMLGARQFNRFTNAIVNSKATFKVIVNEKPIQQFYVLPYDRWEGYEAERLRLLQALSGRVENVVFLATDHHANFVNDARFQTLEAGGPLDSGLLEVATGPVATKTFARQINDTIDNPNGGTLVHDAFLKPPPPDGVGMQCAAIDVFSYAQVEVTAQALTIDLLDAADQPVQDTGNRDVPGPPCAQVVIPKQ
jgi:alkaline phosphatase D